MGNRGEIREGGVQWMSAGSGVIHSEMPTQDTTGLHGFQLWFNLPSEMKMSAPRYRDIPSTALPQVSADRSSLTAIAGDWRVDDHRIAGPLHELAPIAQMADLSLDAFADATFEISSTSNAMVFVFEGAVETSSQTLPAPGLAVFERDCRNNSKSGDAEQNLVTVRASNAGARCLLLTGNPIGEPVVHYGPFVMNTRAEIETALHEYRSGTFLKH
jgi:redox-sensitive bicupin YhaK (pirin superfamily)